MDWSTIIATAVSCLLTGGVATSLLYYTENRRAKQLDNEKSAIEEWQAITEELKRRCAELKEEIAAKDRKIDTLYKDISSLRDRCDYLSSARAALTVLKCKVIDCGRRLPPFGSAQICETKQNNE